MKLNAFIKEIEKIAPLSLMEEWDNSGVQLRCKDNCKRVLVALEINDDVIEKRKRVRQLKELLVDYKPVYTKDELEATLVAKRIIELLKNETIETKNNSHKPVEPKDIAILTRATSSLVTFKKIFQN